MSRQRTTETAVSQAERRAVDTMSVTPRPLLTAQRRSETSAMAVVESALKMVRSARRQATT